MTVDPDHAGPDDALAALSGPLASRIGAFRYDVAADRWWWSDELYRIFGFEPGEVLPTTALIEAHLHPDDRRPGGAGLAGGSVASLHRIVDSRGEARAVAVVAVVRRDGTGTAQVDGHVADVTGAIRALAAPEATRRIRGPEDEQAVVDQAVGIITATTGRSPDVALAQLRAASTRRRVPPHEYARRIVAAATAVARAVDTPSGSRADPRGTAIPPRPHDPPPEETNATAP